MRFLGITGHHDPAILLEAMRRFDFDTVLVALNAADVHRLSFIRTVLPEAARRGLGVIGMKVYCAGHLLGRGGLIVAEAMGHVLSLPGVSHVILGCRTPEEVDQNADVALHFTPLAADRLRALEARTVRRAEALAYYKKGGL